MVAELLQDPPRLIKLYKSIALHRLLVVFISSHTAYYVINPSLHILEHCLVTSGLDNFQRSFETEGGFALLARTLGPMWRSDIQTLIFRMLLGPSGDGKSLLCGSLSSCLLAALDFLLQAASEDEEGGGRHSHARTRSGTVTSIRSVAMSPIITSECMSWIESELTLEQLPTFRMTIHDSMTY